MAKKIVICCDGTWNTPDSESPTNVVKSMRALRPTDSAGTPQIVFYDQGVGTQGFADKVGGGAFGAGLSKNIQDAYRFLANNYDQDDVVYLFGFSRGAYTARSLTGLIGAIGLLRKTEMDALPGLYAIYRTPPEKRDSDTIRQFRTLCVPPFRIWFLGVWDTVGALGIPVTSLQWMFNSRHAFHNTELSDVVENAYQALAIDERRGPFKAAIWSKTNLRDHHYVEQVWFAGVHSNVGGGYPDTGLSDFAFNWMIAKAQSRRLEFDPRYLSSHIHPDVDGTLYNSRKGVYRLLRASIRDVGYHAHANEAIHSSVLDRRSRQAGYDPENLREVLNTVPVVDDGDDVPQAQGNEIS